MNKRISVLSEQAKQYARDQMSHTMQPWLFSAAVFEQKFAELIVKECIEDCRDMFMVGSVSWNLLNEKLDHFGVKV